MDTRSGDLARTDDAYADDELAALYDLVYDGYDEDFGLYEGFAQRGDTPALEICAGSGRVALHLARQGHAVVALDTSSAMLARLEAQLDTKTRPLVRTVEADMRDFDLGETFDLVYVAFCSFEQMLTLDDADAALRGAAKHLAPGGVFVVELRTLAAVDWAPEAAPPLRIEWTRPDPATGDLITKMLAMRGSLTDQATTTSLIFDRASRAAGTVTRRTLDVTMRVFGRFEFELLLEQAGMRIVNLYGGPDFSPFTDDSDTMIVVAELARS